MFKEILLLTPIYVTLFWAIALNIHSRRYHLPKVFLGWFMVAAFFVYLSHFFYFTERLTSYFYIDSVYTLAYLLVYPMYHVYVRLLTVDRSFSIGKHFRYFAVPVFIFLLTVLGYVIAGKKEGERFIVDVLYEGFKPQGLQVFLYIVFVAGRVVFLLQTILYLYLSFKIIRKHNQKLLDYYSNMDERRLTWVQFFNFCFAFTTVSSAVLASLGRNLFLQNEWLLIFPSAVFSTMLFAIGLLGFNQRATFKEIDSSYDTSEEGRHTLHLKTQLEDLFGIEKVFKNPDLKIWDVCEMLGTNRTYVSKIINREYGRNFCSHVNHYRVENAKLLIKQNKNLTNEQIAELSGFGTINSLYRVFQSHENISLTQFRKSFND
ncbi:MAG: helix-turn-helix domain-containing protein [Bacteroidales bacterium]